MTATLSAVSHRKAEGWRGWKLLYEPLLDDRVRKALILDHGNITLGELDAMPDEVLLRSANIGARSKRLIRAMLEYWSLKEAKEIEERAKTVRWEDGDHGSEFITPEEYHRRTAGQPIFPGLVEETPCGAGFRLTKLGETIRRLCTG